MWCRKGKAFCERRFALHRQQPEKDAKCLLCPSEKFSADVHAYKQGATTTSLQCLDAPNEIKLVTDQKLSKAYHRLSVNRTFYHTSLNAPLLREQVENGH